MPDKHPAYAKDDDARRAGDDVRDVGWGGSVSGCLARALLRNRLYLLP